MTPHAWVVGQRGVALPTALVMLAVVTALMLAFAVISQTEPVIAANQLQASQARSLAESGLERAIWALDNPAVSGLTSPLPAPVPVPYDGSAFVAAAAAGNPSLGGFVVRVDSDPAGDSNTRRITSTGWTPTNDPNDKHTKAHRQIQAKVVIIPNLALNAPCALCAKGALSVGGNTTIDGANTNAKCGGNDKHGTYTKDATAVGGSANVAGGPGVNAVAQNQTASTFKSFTLTNADLDALKTLAKKNGTYFGPGFPSGGLVSDGSATWSGSVTFSSSNQIPNGIVFVDTTDGTNLPDPAPSPDTLAAVDIHGNPFSGPGGVFHGWLVVNGSLTISGNMEIDGLVYAVNDLTYNGTGTGAIDGLAISQNIYDTAVTSIDSTANGNSKIIFNCDNVAGGGLVPAGFQLLAGSYREVSD